MPASNSYMHYLVPSIFLSLFGVRTWIIPLFSTIKLRDVEKTHELKGGRQNIHTKYYISHNSA